MLQDIKINEESLRGYTLLSRIENIAKMGKLASTNINANHNNNNPLAVEDFEEIFKMIEELANESTEVISNLSAVAESKN